MRRVAITISILFALLGVVLAAEPELLLRVLSSESSAWLYSIAVVRVVYGAILIGAAGTSRFPHGLKIFGALLIVGGLILPVLGVDTVRSMIHSIYGDDLELMSLAMAFVYALFMFILFALTPPGAKMEVPEPPEA